EIGHHRTTAAPEALRRMSERYRASALKMEEWQPFLLDYTGDVDSTITNHLASARKGAIEWKGKPLVAARVEPALIPDDAVLDRQPLGLLEAEIARLEKLVSVDKDTANKFGALSRRITEENAGLVRLKERLADCEGARGRVVELVQEREA